MKLSDQVCSLEQAKRLKELGVSQSAYFSWCKYRGISDSITWCAADIDHESEIIASAFTVAELGVMLGEPHHVKLYQGKWVSYVHRHQTFYYDRQGEYYNEVEARSALLIHLLENKLITAEEINARLTN